ncbi:MAG TPA: polysaccharide pyruvyl transferase family protein [Candidatus Omnitrophota bacterium]|nr:polysaccharide pyruvyl transferase family protein [Candidatus Omnitrophota bacterium]
MTKNKVAIFGAFDRFNYGDLLFPYILEKHLHREAIRHAIEYYGLIKSDLSRYGGKKTKSVKSLLRKNKFSCGDAIIVAGGDVIGPEWGTMLLHLTRGVSTIIVKYLRETLSRRSFHRFSKYLLGGMTELPWVVDPLLCKQNVNIIYNSVGGTDFNNLCKDQRDCAAKLLNAAKYVSVRDCDTFQSILEAGVNQNKLVLAPDSAILVSEYFNAEMLKCLVSPKLNLLLTEKQKDNYVCIQISRKVTYDKILLLADQIARLVLEKGLNIVLLPIGRVPDHEDHIALKQLKKECSVACCMPTDEASIFDIMFLISKAKAFFGTSLHGNLTACSFCVPSAGFVGVSKVAAFVKTWSDFSLHPIIPFDEVVNTYDKLIKIPKARIIQKRSELIAAAYQNMAAISRIIKGA